MEIIDPINGIILACYHTLRNLVRNFIYPRCSVRISHEMQYIDYDDKELWFNGTIKMEGRKQMK